MASRSDRIEKEVPKDFFWRQSNRIDFDYPTCMACSHWANIPEALHIAVWALLTTPNEAINREPHRVATGATAAPTDTDHSTACPVGGSSKKIMAVAIIIFPPARSAKRHESQGIDPKHRGKAQDFESCIAVAV